MGQAKNRGSREERIEQAQQRILDEAKERSYRNQRINVRNQLLVQLMRDADPSREATTAAVHGLPAGVQVFGADSTVRPS